MRNPIGRLNLTERLVDPRSPDRRPRRVAYALPTLFTAGNLFLGFLATLKAYEGAMYAAAGHMGVNIHFQAAAVMIGVAVFLDGLDGRIARMTNTVSDFGREMDSLADVITFGIAPAVLAYAWGLQFLNGDLGGMAREHFRRAGYFATFFYALCGAARLARFNIQINPIPKNPGRPDRKYFVGLPIPAAAAAIAAVIFVFDGVPVTWWPLGACWIGAVLALALLMIGTWRYRSFKDFNLLRPRSTISIVILGTLIYMVWNYPQPVLLGVALTYVGSGIAVRIGGLLRRLRKAAA
ncbi:MAG: CDP-diacylglycerol--serine O-phosphatidyltransferase [Acidobacteria bacterium]|nr:CDP-diacylglycerol--serine O-phosphatidyltransferase [Acidobacteriota bacterium]